MKAHWRGPATESTAGADLFSDTMERVHQRTCVYQIGYPIVVCTKYRRKVLRGPVEQSLKNILEEVAREKGFHIQALEAQQDHVHLFVSAPPRIPIATLVRWIKGISARRLFLLHPALKRILSRGHLWNPSYYAGTVGEMSEDVIRRYIENQKKAAHQTA